MTHFLYVLLMAFWTVFNFFEPLHYFQYNSGFQTWELSPRFAIRSWAYVLLHWPLAHLGPMFLRLGKVGLLRLKRRRTDADAETSVLCPPDIPRFRLELLRGEVLSGSRGDCQ
jgi:hypothetical protein